MKHANLIRRTLDIIIALGIAGTFFQFLGPAPGYEIALRGVMIMVQLTMVGFAGRALATIKSRNNQDQRLTAESRCFKNIVVKEVCQ